MELITCNNISVHVKGMAVLVFAEVCNCLHLGFWVELSFRQKNNRTPYGVRLFRFSLSPLHRSNVLRRGAHLRDDRHADIYCSVFILGREQGGTGDVPEVRQHSLALS